VGKLSLPVPVKHLLVGLGSLLLLGLSLGVVIPAPTRGLLPLSICAPEISPWLVVGNLGLLLLSGLSLRDTGVGRLALVASGLALGLSIWPLTQLPAVNRAAHQSLGQLAGADYEAHFASDRQTQMRSRPMVLADSFWGLAIAPVRETAGIVFATPDGVPLSLTLYQPAQPGIYPGLVMIYGGAWQRGEPGDNATFARYMANQGYVVWALSYRHAPAYRFPSQVEDVQAAIAFLKAHASDYETDVDRVALLGRSAGAHLAMMAAYQPGPVPVRAVVNYYGPINLLNGYYNLPRPNPLDVRQVLETFLGGPPDQMEERYKAASPSSLVTANLPPSLLIYGGKDRIVEAKFGQAMADRLKQAGSPVVYIQIPWADHAFDAVFNGLSNQLALYYTERFLAWALR
jgi:acetyl esterase/lipase